MSDMHYYPFKISALNKKTDAVFIKRQQPPVNQVKTYLNFLTASFVFSAIFSLQRPNSLRRSAAGPL